ncbi:MAG: D-alanyl-D-alanine carboxypeptidase family protein [Solirubrobacterales bacterium]
MHATRNVIGFGAGLIARRILLAVLGLVLTIGVAASAQARVYSHIVMDADTGEVLHAENPDAHSYPASLTKVMTLYLLFDALEQGRVSLSTMMPVSLHATQQAPSKLGLKVGDRISVEDAVLALVTKSANDVAVVIAEAVGGDEDSFAEMMTKKAHALGMASTTYQNASGLPDGGQISTVRDQALLARALVRQHARYYHYFSTRQFRWQNQPISTHNRLMLRYQGADGIKTGYINASGFNLIASAKRDGHRIIGVVFGGQTAAWRDNRMAQILDKGFARLRGEAVDIRSASVDHKDRAELDSLVASAKGIKPAMAKTAKPTKVASGRGGRDDEARGSGDADPSSWSVQVGAFGEYDPAHKAAAQAAKKLGGLLAHASISVNKGKQGHQQVYRARLTGFTEDEARAACRKLARAKKACSVVQPS